MRRPHPALAAGLAILGLLIAAVVLSWRSRSALAAHPGGALGHVDRALLLALLAASFGAYLLALWLLRRHDLRVGAAIALAVAVQAAPLAAPLLASTDAWTYWDYGRIAVAHHGNPYVEPPDAYAHDPAYAAMGARWRGRTSLYGPGFTLASEPIARAAAGSRQAVAWIFKALACVAALAAAVVAARMTRAGAFAAAFVGWNPVLAVHAAGGGHNDAWIGALMLLALAAAAAGRRAAAGGAWALAVAVKWVPLVFLMLGVLDGRARRAVSAPAVVVVAAAVAALASWRYGVHWLRALVPLVENARLETRYALPHRLQSTGVPHDVAVGLAAAVLVTGLAWLAVQASRGRPRLALAAVLLLATTPYLAVWYLAWAVPLAAVEERDRWARIGTLALGAYLLPQTLSY